MEFSKSPGCAGKLGNASLPGSSRLHLKRQIAVCLVAFAAFAAVAQDAPTAAKPDAVKPASATPPPDTAGKTPDPQTKAQSDAAAAAQRKQQIAETTAQLLKLANDLKEEVNKTDKDTLSLAVIRKADEIEKLAHSVQDQ
jgi:hypothetical protein